MKKFIFNFILFGSLLLILQYCIPYWGFARFEKLNQLDEYLEEKSEVFLFGSSVNTYSDSLDIDKRWISKMLDSLQEKYAIKAISNGGYHLEVFYAYLNYIKKSEDRPKLAIIEINLRSFSLLWETPPDQFKTQKDILVNNPFLIIWNHLLGKEADFLSSFEKYMEKDVYKGDLIIGKVKDFYYNPLIVTDLDKKNKFIFHYLYNLNSTHPKIKALNEIIEICRDSKIKVLFFITPVDYQSGEKYLPQEFKNIVGRNSAVIKGVLSEACVPYLDLSLSLDSTQFSYKHFSNEHLKQTGRFHIANEISKWMDLHMDNLLKKK